MRKVVSASAAVKGAVVGVVAIGFMTAQAAAAVINIGTTGATVTCSVSCQGFTGAGGADATTAPPSGVNPTGVGTLSDTLAQLYNGQPADETDEGLRLSTLVGSDVGPGTKYDPPSNPFDSSAEYIVLKIGPYAVFIKNTSGGSQTYTYSDARMLGLSHYTEFGDAVIPLPAAAWLMLAGLGGLGFASRRKKAA